MNLMYLSKVRGLRKGFKGGKANFLGEV